MAKKVPTVIDVLKRMRTILRKGWTQDEFAINAKGQSVISSSPNAVKFCLLGAKTRVLDELDPVKPWILDESVNDLLLQCIRPCFRYIPDFNDAPGRKKSEILKVVSCAIEKAQAK